MVGSDIPWAGGLGCTRNVLSIGLEVSQQAMFLRGFCFILLLQFLLDVLQRQIM